MSEIRWNVELQRLASAQRLHTQSKEWKLQARHELLKELVYAHNEISELMNRAVLAGGGSVQTGVTRRLSGATDSPVTP
jgi:hypothetical protein